jgi:hypothetical protein
MFFKLNIPDKIYKELNRDRSLNYHFRAKNVGECSKIYDEFRLSGGGNKKQWKDFYFTKQPKEPLLIASNYIVDKYHISLKIAKEYVAYRVIGQTWNGMKNEELIISELQEEFKNITFKKSDYYKDQNLFVDWEAYENKTLLFGIQIKPLSYLKMSSPYQLKAKDNHNKQANEYKRIFKVPHIIIYYDWNKIHNPVKVFNKINTILLFQIDVNL